MAPCSLGRPRRDLPLAHPDAHQHQPPSAHRPPALWEAGWRLPQRRPPRGDGWGGQGTCKPQGCGLGERCLAPGWLPIPLCEPSRSRAALSLGLPPRESRGAPSASEGCGRVTQAGGLGPSHKECSFPCTLELPGYGPLTSRLPTSEPRLWGGGPALPWLSPPPRLLLWLRPCSGSRMAGGDPRHQVTGLSVPAAESGLPSNHGTGPSLG